VTHKQKMTQDYIRAILEQLFTENGKRLSQAEKMMDVIQSLSDLTAELEKRVAKLEETK